MKQRISLCLHLLCFLFLLGSCGKIDYKEYIEEVNKNIDYVSRVDQGDLFAECSFKPAEYLALVEIGNAANRGNIEEQFTKVKEDFSKGACFILKIGRNDRRNIFLSGVTNKQEYSLKLNYVTNYLNKDFFLLNEVGDTVRPLIYEYQRSYGNSPDAVFIFSFPKDDIVKSSSGTINLYYRDRVFGLAPVKFFFKEKIIKEEQPKLDFKS